MAGLWLFSGLVEAGGGLKVSLSTFSGREDECPFSVASREVLSAAGSAEAIVLRLGRPEAPRSASRCPGRAFRVRVSEGAQASGHWAWPLIKPRAQVLAQAALLLEIVQCREVRAPL